VIFPKAKAYLKSSSCRVIPDGLRFDPFPIFTALAFYNKTSPPTISQFIVTPYGAGACVVGW